MRRPTSIFGMMRRLVSLKLEDLKSASPNVSGSPVKMGLLILVVAGGLVALSMGKCMLSSSSCPARSGGCPYSASR
ncbi:MAG: hypothetical protein AAGF12_31760 [Myxococcota bacterium]